MSQDAKSEPAELDFNRAMPIFALVFVDVLGLTVLLPLLHLYAAAYGATPLEIGIVAASFPLAQLVGVPIMGALSDRFGRKPLLLISQVSTCLSFILLGLANSLWLIVLSRVIDGTFGANLATAQAALTDITSDENRAQGLGLTGAAFGLGFLFGPIISFVSLEFTDDLSIPAYIAAVYSFFSILLTLFVFKETLPQEKRGNTLRVSPLMALEMLRRPQIRVLLVLMFVQQVVFYGFETLLGLFTLSRLGLLGQGNAILFLWVGVILVVVQGRFIGKWTRKYGERKVAFGALAALAVGLLLLSATPNQPHIFYVRERVEREIAIQNPTSAEAIIGDINITLPPNEGRSIVGVLWIFAAVIPLAVGSGLIRASLNSLMTKRVAPTEYGRVLGVSASFVSAANAIAPIAGALLFQAYGAGAPFFVGGVLMSAFFVLAVLTIQQPQAQSA